jgi:hypothetical protein
VCGISEQSLVPSVPICSYDHDIFCVCFDVMYSGEYNVSDVTVSVYSIFIMYCYWHRLNLFDFVSFGEH